MAAGASSSSLAVVGPAAAMVAASYCRPSAGAAHTLAGRSTRWAAGCRSSRCLRSSSHQTTSGPPEKQRRLRKIRVCTKWATRATTPAGATYDNNQYKVTHEQRKIEHATGIGCSSDDATHLWLAGTIGLHKFHHEVVVARDQQLLLRLSIACNTHGSTSCSAPVCFTCLESGPLLSIPYMQSCNCRGCHHDKGEGNTQGAYMRMSVCLIDQPMGGM